MPNCESELDVYRSDPSTEFMAQIQAKCNPDNALGNFFEFDQKFQRLMGYGEGQLRIPTTNGASGTFLASFILVIAAIFM